MAVINETYVIITVFLTIMLCQSSVSVKCFHCNSANNSACLDLHLQKMHPIIPIVDCARSLPPPANGANEFFCRKITQTILHAEKTPEVRITRGCGWVKSKRACYTNDNKDHLETVCQCFGDMCNAAPPAPALRHLAPAAACAAILAVARTWRGI